MKTRIVGLIGVGYSPMPRLKNDISLCEDFSCYSLSFPEIHIDRLDAGRLDQYDPEGLRCH